MADQAGDDLPAAAAEAAKKKKNKKKKKADGEAVGPDVEGADDQPDAPAADGGAEEADGAEEEGGATAAKKKKNKNKKKGGGADAADGAPEGGGADAAKPKEDDECEEGDEEEDGDEAAGAGAKKKKRNRKKKTGGGEAAGSAGTARFSMPAQDNSVFRRVSDWPVIESWRQCPEFTVPVVEQYSDTVYPIGQIQEYTNHNAFRTTSAEKRELERLHQYDYDKIRLAAECHRQVRRYAQSYIRPGLLMTEICQRLERKTHELIKANGLDCGWGFPTGCSLNWVAAHYTPNYGDTTVLQQEDVCKLDFGVQVGGRIVDSAFTIAFEPKYDPIIEATQEGTNTGIKEAGIDARFTDIGEAIQETIESYEIELNGKTTPIRPVRNLNGHSMEPYRIHAGKSVGIVKNGDMNTMEEGEFYAIETFASNGKAYVVEDLECSHYMKVFEASPTPLRVKSAKALLHAIDQNFGTLAFCRRWLDDLGQTRHIMALKNLVDNDLVQSYPPLCDQRGSYVTQMEHTILLRPTCKEVVSRGDDF